MILQETFYYFSNLKASVFPNNLENIIKNRKILLNLDTFYVFSLVNRLKKWKIPFELNKVSSCLHSFCESDKLITVEHLSNCSSVL